MSYNYANLAKSVVSETRAVGSSALLIGAGDGELFGEPTTEAPMRCVVYANKQLLTILHVIGRDGDTLNLGEPVSGYSDVEIPKGSIVANVLLANDLTDLWSAISEGTGKEGPPGKDGAPGAPGTVVRSGEEAPSDDLGVDGDYFFNLATGDVYKRQEGTYVVVGNIKGAAGSPGDDGSKIRVDEGAPSNSLGADGDLYVDVSAWDVYQRDSGAYSNLGSIRGPKGDPGDGADIDESDLVHKSGDETITGVKTLTTPKFDGGASIVDSVGTELSGFDSSGYAFPAPIRFILAKSVDLTSGTNLAGRALVPYSGKIAKVLVAAETNGAGGGFSLQIKVGSTSIFASPITVAASDTSTKTFSSFAADSIAGGDSLTIDASSVGSGVQGVEVLVVPLTRNR